MHCVKKKTMTKKVYKKRPTYLNFLEHVTPNTYIFCLNFIISIFESATRPFKLEMKLIYTEENVCKDTKIHELSN